MSKTPENMQDKAVSPVSGAKDGIPPEHLAIIAAAAQSCGVPSAHLAVIAAAVQAVGGATRTLRMSNFGRRTAWAIGGRQVHQTSHTPSTRRR